MLWFNEWFFFSEAGNLKVKRNIKKRRTISKRYQQPKKKKKNLDEPPDWNKVINA